MGFYIDKDNGHLKVKWTLHESCDRLLRLDISRSYGCSFEISLPVMPH